MILRGQTRRGAATLSPARVFGRDEPGGSSAADQDELGHRPAVTRRACHPRMTGGGARRFVCREGARTPVYLFFLG